MSSWLSGHINCKALNSASATSDVLLDESRMDRIMHIGRTREVRLTATHQDVERLKDQLMLERGVSLAEAEKIIGGRKISIKTKPMKPASV